MMTDLHFQEKVRLNVDAMMEPRVVQEDRILSLSGSPYDKAVESLYHRKFRINYLRRSGCDDTVVNKFYHGFDFCRAGVALSLFGLNVSVPGWLAVLTIIVALSL